MEADLEPPPSYIYPKNFPTIKATRVYTIGNLEQGVGLNRQVEHTMSLHNLQELHDDL